MIRPMADGRNVQGACFGDASGVEISSFNLSDMRIFCKARRNRNFHMV